jgi:hypothetical protein
MIRFSETQAYVLLLRSVEGTPLDVLTTLRRAADGVALVEPSRESAEHFIFVLRPEAILGELFERLASTGVEVLDCRQEHSQIEQAFLRLTAEPR